MIKVILMVVVELPLREVSKGVSERHTSPGSVFIPHIDDLAENSG